MSDCSVASDGAATALCTNCGLCCTGALHHAVLLVDGEMEEARAAGLQVENRDRPIFALPCPSLEGTRCGVYERRPRSCGYYRCQLLRDMDCGKIQLPDALDKVRIARALFAEVQAALPERMSLRRARAIVAGREEEPEFSPELRLRMTALTYYLDRHFRNDEDGKYFVLSEIPTTGRS